jgi:hypothetical protein
MLVPTRPLLEQSLFDESVNVTMLVRWKGARKRAFFADFVDLLLVNRYR